MAASVCSLFDDASIASPQHVKSQCATIALVISRCLADRAAAPAGRSNAAIRGLRRPTGWLLAGSALVVRPHAGVVVVSGLLPAGAVAVEKLPDRRGQYVWGWYPGIRISRVRRLHDDAGRGDELRRGVPAGLLSLGTPDVDAQHGHSAGAVIRLGAKRPPCRG
jgi:hypothetical protein